jgi:hypothetical protein
MGGACSTYRGGEVYTLFWRGNLRERDHLDGRIILRWIFWKWNGGMDWIDVAQDRDRWQVLVKAIINLQVP